jgi:ssDNA-binding replication factor A large subunit
MIDPATADRLRRALAGEEVERRLQVRDLAPGDAGVLDVEVVRWGPTRSYSRKRGGTGQLARLSLADATGEVEMVLWDDEVPRLRDWPPGTRLRLRGAPVKSGWKGGVELGLGSARVEAAPPPPGQPS